MLMFNTWIVCTDYGCGGEQVKEIWCPLQ